MSKRKSSIIKSAVCLLNLSPFFLYSTTEEVFSSLEEEYTPKYCSQLEIAYGDGMMSEGGQSAIEHMFDQIHLRGKTALDIGSGLGGVALYLADTHSMLVTGLEVNPWMVTESEKRIPEHLKNRVDFLLSFSNSHLPSSRDSYDIIYSKGVLTHLETKDDIFKECYRLLKEDGVFVITDWLSSEEKRWGNNIAQLVQLEHLALFPESESGYIELLKKSGFTILSVRDDSQTYLRYNQEIVDRLSDISQKPIFLKFFAESELQESITGYQSIAKAIEVGELRVLRFVAKKT